MESVWKPYNPQPKKKIVADCVKRTVCAVTGWDYMYVQRMLNRIKRDLIAQGHTEIQSYRSRKVGIELCRRMGWERIGNDDDHECYDEMTGVLFAKSHPTGQYILQMPNYWVACVNGQLYDTYDTSQNGVAWAFVVER